MNVEELIEKLSKLDPKKRICYEYGGAKLDFVSYLWEEDKIIVLSAVSEGTYSRLKAPIKPYSNEEYEEAKKQGLDLDDWNDYVKYFGVGEEPNYDDM